MKQFPPEQDTILARLDAAVTAQNAVDRLWSSIYFEARMGGFLDAAVVAGPHSRTRALAMTRAENEKRGRAVRWGSR